MSTTIQCAAIFSDNMVLQRGKPVPVWGTGTDGVSVTVTWATPAGTIKEETKVRQGTWRVTLPPQVAGDAGILTVSGGDTVISFANVVFGDVWFAGGQSNMELELQNCQNGAAELAACANPDIRFYQVVKRAVIDADYLADEAKSRWKVCAPDTAATLSAVAYFFARKITLDLKVPVGIINCSWGGTSISAWMSKAQLAKSAAGQRYLDDYAALVGGKTDAEWDAEMKAYFDDWSAWDERVLARRAKDPDVTWETLNKECGICPWPQPAGNKSPYCPANLYNSMVKRVVPFALRGFLYYQGEEDEQRVADYFEMLYYLIGQWRNDWDDDTLPFLIVQLPMYASREDVEAGLPAKNWCLLREAQYRASQTIAHTGLAVIIDCGEYDNIHPLDKQTVGFRLALQALKVAYGKKFDADGPLFAAAQQEGSAIRVSFSQAERGLEFRGKSEGFEVAGAEGVYYPADAVIDGNTIVARSSKVSAPERVRYAWIKYGPTPLYGKNGLPAMPFRSHRMDSIDSTDSTNRTDGGV
ncbi:9-O-acetylesterase [Spirochaetia bacterium]|nr:9-O-acetylesterase [Spirochaetia bacterium]